MTLSERIAALYRRLEGAQWIPQLLVRLFLGGFFALSGYRHVKFLDAIVERFTDWGIPMPYFNAVLSSYTELIGGALILLGLGTRIVALPLAFNMLIAIVTVKLKKVDGIGDFLALDEPLYGLVFFWLFFAGAGKASLDYVIARARGPSASAPIAAPLRTP